MKKLSFSLFIISLLTIVFFFSCSAEEEDTSTAPAAVQSPEPVEYTLSVSSSEGGGESDELSFGKKFLQAETVELGSNGSSGGLFDVEEMDPEGQRGEDYEMIYRKGFKIMPEEQRTITVEGTVTEEISVKNPPDRMFYVVEVYVSDPDRRDEWSGGDHDGDQNGEEKETTEDSTAEEDSAAEKVEGPLSARMVRAARTVLRSACLAFSPSGPR